MMINYIVHIILLIIKFSPPPIRLSFLTVLEWIKHKYKEKQVYITLLQIIIVFSTMNTYHVHIERHVNYFFIFLSHMFHVFYILWNFTKKGSKIISLLLISIICLIPNQLYNIFNMTWYIFIIRMLLFRVMIISMKRKIKPSLKDFSRWCWIFFVHEYLLIMIIPQLIIEIYYI
jgi:hypothetical protein